MFHNLTFVFAMFAIVFNYFRSAEHTPSHKKDDQDKCDSLHSTLASQIKTKTHRGTAVYYSSWFSLILVKTLVAVLTLVFCVLCGRAEFPEDVSSHITPATLAMKQFTVG